MLHVEMAVLQGTHVFGCVWYWMTRSCAMAEEFSVLCTVCAVPGALRDEFPTAPVLNACVWPYDSGEVIVQASAARCFVLNGALLWHFSCCPCVCTSACRLFCRFAGSLIGVSGMLHCV